MADKLRLGLATAVAPLAAPLLLLVLIIAITDEPVSGLNRMMLFWVTVVSYLGCLLLGLPIVRILLRSDNLTVAALGAAGFLAGSAVTFLVAIALLVFFGISGPGSVEAKGVIIFGIIGAIVGSVFGLIAGARPI